MGRREGDERRTERGARRPPSQPHSHALYQVVEVDEEGGAVAVLQLAQVAHVGGLHLRGGHPLRRGVDGLQRNAARQQGHGHLEREGAEQSRRRVSSW